uniref:Uncharacterized protein n=1 Tax=Arundo donax TaxID=35708 RepID=A0A0A9C481_ARUDO
MLVKFCLSQLMYLHLWIAGVMPPSLSVQHPVNFEFICI